MLSWFFLKHFSKFFHQSSLSFLKCEQTLLAFATNVLHHHSTHTLTFQVQQDLIYGDLMAKSVLESVSSQSEFYKTNYKDTKRVREEAWVMILLHNERILVFWPRVSQSPEKSFFQSLRSCQIYSRVYQHKDNSWYRQWQNFVPELSFSYLT